MQGGTSQDQNLLANRQVKAEYFNHRVIPTFSLKTILLIENQGSNLIMNRNSRDECHMHFKSLKKKRKKQKPKKKIGKKIST